MDEVRKNEIIAVILVSIGIFLLLSIFTFTSQDLFFYTSDPNPVSQNMAGTWGAYLSGAMLFFVGKAAYVVPMLIILWGVSRFMQMRPDKMFLKFFGIAALLIAAASALGITSVLNRAVAFQRGGVVGTFVSEFLFKYLGMVGAVVFLVALIILSMLIATDFLLFPLIVRVYKGTARAMENAKDKISEKVPLPTVERVPAGKLKDAKADIAKKLEIVRKQVEESRRSVMTDRKSSDTPSGSAVKRSQNQAEDITVTTSNPKFVKPKPVKVAQPAANRIQNADGYKLPSLELLITSPKTAEKDREEDFKLKAALLEKTLLEFEVDAKVVKINKGPVITMYELEPAIGTKVNEITSLTDNISLSMKSTNIRIVAPLPGKGTIGIEVPNDKIEMVRLKDIIQTEDFVKEDSPLKIALGKDIMGNPMVLDLAAMPHLLIAGATGSGKTVCINCIISSMLFSSAPSDLKFIMVDPKRVELQMFEGIPHLLCPIVTNPKKVASILAWLIGEMERRYTVFADKGVRNIASYKERAAKDWERLPYIVLIIDELADLMVSARQDVEGSIMRLAQLSRAAGIHMILATQRPSVNVITGVIKANFPARVSFKVTQQVDSRTILDTKGAEKLLGRGDMLIMQPGQSDIMRGQCSLVEDSEIRDLVKAIKEQGEPQYLDEILERQENTMNGAIQGKDDLYIEAIKIVLATKQASASMLQRRLSVGYTRAARMIDIMQAEGIVGPPAGAKPREILIESIEEIENRK